MVWRNYEFERGKRGVIAEKAKKEKKIRRATKFICNDCGLIWELMNPTLIGRNERIYCPKCGDHFEVKVYKAKKRERKEWSDEEIVWLDELINGDMKLYKLMELTGRSRQAVMGRRNRRVRELERSVDEIEVKPLLYWNDEEIALALKHINGEINLAELIKLTGRTYSGCDKFTRRLKKKMKDSKKQ